MTRNMVTTDIYPTCGINIYPSFSKGQVNLSALYRAGRQLRPGSAVRGCQGSPLNRLSG